MLQLRKSSERGFFDHGWLRTYHTFSFADYRDPAHARFRVLRVINEDIVAPGQGFGMHSHQDMEIVTLILSGALEHRDSLGNGEVLRPGELQRMTAGTGIMHSEFNPSSAEPVHLYQIWLFPREKNLAPSYEQKAFDPSQRVNRWQLVASPNQAAGSLLIHQDAKIFLADLEAGKTLDLQISTGRYGWLQVLTGSVQVEDLQMGPSDGLALSDVNMVNIRASEGTALLYFELP